MGKEKCESRSKRKLRATTTRVNWYFDTSSSPGGLLWEKWRQMPKLAKNLFVYVRVEGEDAANGSIAEVLKVRKDVVHDTVLVKIRWYYWPSDPQVKPFVLDAKDSFMENEILATNHTAIIDASSIESLVNKDGLVDSSQRHADEIFFCRHFKLDTHVLEWIPGSVDTQQPGDQGVAVRKLGTADGADTESSGEHLYKDELGRESSIKKAADTESAKKKVIGTKSRVTRSANEEPGPQTVKRRRMAPPTRSSSRLKHRGAE